MDRAASCGTKPGVRVEVERRRAPPRRHGRSALVQPEIVEVDVAPAAALTVHQPDHDLPAHVLRQVDDHAFEVLAIVPRRPEDNLARILPDQLDARRRPGAATHKKAGERLRNPETERTSTSRWVHRPPFRRRRSRSVPRGRSAYRPAAR